MASPISTLIRARRPDVLRDQAARAHDSRSDFSGDRRQAMANGPMDFEFNRPGQWAFYDAGVGHTMENLGDAAIELLEIEVRGR